MVDTWEANLTSELAFWRYILADRGVAEGTADDIAMRLNPTEPLQDHLRALLPSRGAIRILDIGAGPMTTVGKVWGKRKVEIVAIDVLADEYDKLLEEVGIVPPLRTITGRGETVDQQFEIDSFDLVHIQNSLDHCADPIAVLKAVYNVVKPNGAIYLSHSVNEAEFHHYEGLHQWNLECHGDNLFVWDRSSRTMVNDLLPGAQIHCRVTPHPPKAGWLVVEITKVTV